MNLYLHNIGDIYGKVPVTQGDSLLTDPGYRVDYVLTNPPFGKKSSLTFTNEEGEQEEEDLVYNRQDFWTTSSNKQLNFVQHINTILKTTGKAAVVVPDNVLFEGGAGETIREKLLTTTDFHTILRLPTGIFYKPGVKANVIFFDKKPANAKAQTKFVWIYDLRTNIHFTLKQNPMTDADLDDFIKCYNPDNRFDRHETYTDKNPEGRFRKFSADEILKSDKKSLDIFWIKDKSLADLENLPSPDVLAADIIENLQSALESFQELKGQLKKSNKNKGEYSDNYLENKIIKELSGKYNISIDDAARIEDKLKKIGFIEICGDIKEKSNSDSLLVQFITLDTGKGLETGWSQKAFNCIINIRIKRFAEVIKIVMDIVSGIKGYMNDDPMSMGRALLTLLSLSYIYFTVDEIAILLALDKRKMDEDDCFIRTNKILTEYGYDEIARNEFDRAISKLYECHCISITDGFVEIVERIKIKNNDVDL